MMRNKSKRPPVKINKLQDRIFSWAVAIAHLSALLLKIRNHRMSAFADELPLAQQSQNRDRQRLDTEDIFPNYRQSYQNYELLEQISVLKSMVALKDKQIFYLSSQTVSIKEEFTQKIVALEQSLAENKKELTEHRFMLLKSRRVENKKNEDTLFEYKGKYELELGEQKKAYEDMIQQLNISHREEVQVLNDKIASLLTVEKKERTNLMDNYELKFRNQDQKIQHYASEMAQVAQDRDRFNSELAHYEKELERIRLEHSESQDRGRDRENQLTLQALKYKNESQNLKNSCKIKEQGHAQEVGQLQAEVGKLQEQVATLNNSLHSLKQALKSKDEQIASILSKKKNPNVATHAHSTANLAKSCAHEGLIRQLELSLQLKNREVNQLTRQLSEWAKYIGFDRSIEQRTSDLLNASSEALQAQSEFCNTLRNQTRGKK